MDDRLSLPWKQLYLIYFCRFIEPISYNVYLPFIYFMIKDLNITTEENIGYYCGLITSANAVAQFISGIPLGSLSDRIGRKPVILIGLTSISIFFLLFGLGKSFTWLITVNFIAGLLNGNPSVLKSMTAEITQDFSTSKKTQAFLFLHITFNLGMVVGAAIGGYLSEPVTKFPSIFKEGAWVTNFLKEYPYFLPCFIGFIMSITGWILCLFKMKETLIKKSHEKQSEETPLLQQEQQQEVASSSRFDTSNKKHSIGEILTPAVLLVCSIYCLAIFQLDYLRVFFPIWASTPVDKGGLGFKSSEIGTLTSYSGTIMLAVQVLILHHLTKRWGIIRTLQYCFFTALSASFIVGLFRIPSLLLKGKIIGIWFGLLVSMSIQSLGQSMSIILGMILVNNSVMHTDTLGFINAFNQCCASAARVFSPVITGLIWSSTLQMTWIPLDIRSYSNWAILGIFGVFAFFLSTRLDPAQYTKTHR